jgi:hypothetical protein
MLDVNETGNIVRAVSGFSVLTALAAATIAVLTTIAAALAKLRARWRVQNAAMFDAELRHLVESRELTAAEADALRQKLEPLIRDLKPRDQRYIREGLYQGSRSGAARYLKDLVGRA